MLSAKRALPAVLWAVGVALRLSDEGDGKIPRQDRGIYLQAEECPFEENSFIISPKNFRWDDKKGRAIASCSSCFPTDPSGQIALPAETVAPVYAAVSKTTAAFLRFRGGSEPDVNELGSVETVLVVDNTREKAERVRFKTSAIPLLESTASSYESNESDGGGVANLQSFYWVASRYALSPSSSEPPGPTLEGKIESAVTIREPRPARVVFGRACAEGSRLWGTPFQGVSLSDSMKAEFAELSALRFSSLSHDSPFSCLLQATDAALPGGEEGNTRDSERERASHVSRPLEALRSALCVPKSTGGSSEGPRLCLAPIPQFQKSADSGDGLGASPEEKDHKSFASWIEQVLAARRMKVSRGHTEKGTLSHRLSGLRDILRRSGRRIWKFRFGLTRLFALPSRSEESEETEGQILGRLEEEEEASAQEGSRGSGEVGSLPLGWHWSVGLLPVSVSEGTSTSGVWEQNAADVILEVCAHALGVPSCLDWEMRTSAEGTSEKKGNRGPSPQSLALKGSHLSVALDPLHSELSEQTERRSASTWGAVLGGRGGTLLPSRTALFADSRKAVEMYTRRGVAECGNL
uniref:Uncharacterized protein n=1 Tax=Chromera velia CCMP2878 TaxID=1169474 RepID=A0A0G4GIW8_9ALVE|eukprot:Cvel_22049.t1-p1 / transcript=Cvel_22049.t1 / gene=Cvel_22049 / organism=Chromera_velia_CCMP2878 / gene_product=hypothetical protein / transcript_product=hypothetical protein / location=Cvel_scaffold2130:1534-10780(-) / protein_length=578 / sequence_SO=supercontig / SO=protein_coding / is_pseudo=false